MYLQTSCVADQPKVLCIIRDMTNADVQNKNTLNLPASTSVAALIEEVARMYGYEADSFSLLYEKTELSQTTEVRLRDIDKVSGLVPCVVIPRLLTL